MQLDPSDVHEADVALQKAEMAWQRAPDDPASLDLLAACGVTWVTVSNMPLAQIEKYKAQMGWTLPFVSSHGTSFADDCGASDGFMLSVFLRDGTDVYRTYSTTARGLEFMMGYYGFLYRAPLGRNEGDQPQMWMRRHDEYSTPAG